MKRLRDYRAVIFDVDGTLYFQPRLRMLMAFKLLLHYSTRPQSFREVLILRAFRSIRESTESFDNLSVEQYQRVADRFSVSAARVESIVQRWIYTAPLPYLKTCADRQLIDFLNRIRSLGQLAVGYSDYPLESKLEAMGISMDAVFCATDEDINALKPHPAGLQRIMARLSLSPEECCLIGDRDSKDGAAARSVGMDYRILPKSKTARSGIYREWQQEFND